jgi:hypothetical protein
MVCLFNQVYLCEGTSPDHLDDIKVLQIYVRKEVGELLILEILHQVTHQVQVSLLLRTALWRLVYRTLH